MKINCGQCGYEIELSEALTKDIQKTVLAAEHKKHELELKRVKTEAEESSREARAVAVAIIQKKLDDERVLLRQQATNDLELAKRKMILEATNAQKMLANDQEAILTGLKVTAESAELESKKLRAEQGALMDSLRAEKLARANAELESQKRLAASEDKIREETAKNSEEKYRLKIAEQDKKLLDTQKALEEAQRKASQGSQQNQGEVLELDLENRLTQEFPLDEIIEVKKGERGADIKQNVKNQNLALCGILLWETKNGKWQPAWVPKFKQDIRAASASMGVIVSHEMPADMGDMKHLETNVWVVKPRLAVVLAAALRGTILQVDAANKMSAGKDAKMEALYQFLVGPEFRHHIEAIVENYGMLQAEMEKEKRAAALRWAHQEKSIRAVIDNTIGLYGDLQGITNRALPSIKTLEPGDEAVLIEDISLVTDPNDAIQQPPDLPTLL